MTADIAQLCDLIAEPAEPLALRLSSNLMYGVVRCVTRLSCVMMMNICGFFHRVYKGWTLYMVVGAYT
jgi:hypothetical protein